MSIPEFFLARAYELFSKHPTIFFGVGGGYLRSSNKREGLKALIAHGSQILLSRIGIAPRCSIYLPQSVGPFRYGVGNLLRRVICGNVNTIFLRDDKSISELEHRRGIRTGDLAVLEIVRHLPRKECGQYAKNPQIFFVFRDLGSKQYSDKYLQNIKKLKSLLPDAIFAIQSSGRGNSDNTFYEDTLGVKDHVLLKDVLARGNAIVVSVRLHGSLESILEGVPSVHIAYERKGRAAFSDLGLDAYSFHASDFDPDAVAAAVRSIAFNPADYWRCMNVSPACCYSDLLSAIKHDLDKFTDAHNGW
ncbi:conserved hypothetical protein [Burkholderia sp. H160]|nr:conserved hypothetical protein [Burkholderia sp. H160]